MDAINPTSVAVTTLDSVLAELRAAGESTRLRILAVLAHGELTVSELCRVLGQTQPRVSRHLRLLCEAGLLTRQTEGTSAFYAHRHEPGRSLLGPILALLDPGDQILEADQQRLAAIRAERADQARQYFEVIAEQWDSIRSLHVDDAEVEQAILDVALEHQRPNRSATGPEGQEGEGAARPIGTLLDVGTGTGRILELLADRVDRGLGIDLSSNMLRLARSNLATQGLHHLSVRQGNVYALNVPAHSIDLVVLHHVLHYLDEPVVAIAEAAATVRPGGQLIVVDYAPHHLERLRREHAHRRLGFDEHEIKRWCEQAGLTAVAIRHLRPSASVLDGDAPDQEPLTVSLWTATQPATPISGPNRVGSAAHDLQPTG